MNNKKFLAAIFFILLVVINIYVVKINAEVKDDYLNNALKNTESTIKEIGLTANYKTNSIGKEECNFWIENMNLHNKKVTINNNKSYCVNFKDKNLSGYIESTKVINHYDISICVNLVTNKNEISQLKRKVTKSINCRNTCYMYVKAKSKIKSIDEINHNIKSYFANNNPENLKTTKMGNIISTTMYTGKYDYIFDDNKKVDLNYAICKYTDGNYVIIGTPILNINY